MIGKYIGKPIEIFVNLSKSVGIFYLKKLFSKFIGSSLELFRNVWKAFENVRLESGWPYILKSVTDLSSKMIITGLCGYENVISSCRKYLSPVCFGHS